MLIFYSIVKINYVYLNRWIIHNRNEILNETPWVMCEQTPVARRVQGTALNDITPLTGKEKCQHDGFPGEEVLRKR